MKMRRLVLIEERLRATLSPEHLEVLDDSPTHAGHAGSGGGHFSIYIVSMAFTGKTILQRHRLIHAAVKDLMYCEIHALSIKKAQTPEEARSFKSGT
jgi:BolA protein